MHIARMVVPISSMQTHFFCVKRKQNKEEETNEKEMEYFIIRSVHIIKCWFNAMYFAYFSGFSSAHNGSSSCVDAIQMIDEKKRNVHEFQPVFINIQKEWKKNVTIFHWSKLPTIYIARQDSIYKQKNEDKEQKKEYVFIYSTAYNILCEQQTKVVLKRNSLYSFFCLWFGLFFFWVHCMVWTCHIEATDTV